jgi:hypothetical protein
MNKSRVFTALILAFSVLLFLAQPVKAQPLLPSEFYGTVMINGVTSTTATVVGKINSVQYGGAASWDCVTLPYCVYVLSVPSDDADTTGIIEGGVEGNTVEFYVNGVKANQTGTWHSGTIVRLDLTVTSTPPGAFGKTTPTNGATGVVTNPTLSWGASTGATSYQYCYAITSGCTNWTSVGANTSVGLTGLLNNQIYYWQVQAVNVGGTTLANTGTYWSFTTVVAAPGAFGKTAPANGATGVVTSPTLSWGASTGATSYQYCYAITSGCTNWTSVGTNTSVVLTGLLNNQLYYWQVRAVNAGGTTLANTGTYWSFTTVVVAPGAFGKNAPANGATGVVTSPTLSWGASTGAASYQYCYATTSGCTNWTSVGTNMSVGLTGLLNNQLYYWQVQAVNVGGNTLANTGTYWSFTTVAVTNISLNSGWNLVSFPLHPTNTDIANVLASVSGKYDLVYAWDATGAHSSAGNWIRYAPGLPGNTLSTVDETQGLWIRMTSAATLSITGTAPTTTNISLLTTANGWNLVGYPSLQTRTLPGAFTSNGVMNYSLVYAYHANDTSDPWKRYAPGTPGNDLLSITPNWGYWIKVSSASTWTVGY